jgi:hypothetical protein
MTSSTEKRLEWSLKGHLPGCQFHFAPLDTCECTQVRMQDRIGELEYCLQWLARGKFINGLGDGHDMAQRVISKARQGLKGDQDGR